MAQARDDGIVVGYGARETGLRRPASWGAEGMRAALLRRDVDRPLSIDRLVWPSVFDFHPELEPPYTGLYAGLWDSLQRLRQHLDRQELSGEEYVIAAFTVITAGCQSAEVADISRCGEVTVPGKLDAGWRFLGYDVADDSATSALITMRAAADAADPEAHRRRWAGHLNRAHLFDDLAPAVELRRHSNRVIPAHAPFFVYGLWSIREGDTKARR